MGSNDAGHLEIDGCDALDLAREHGTPLWVVSERTIRHNYNTLLRAFRSEYERSRLVYASKANPEPAVIRIAWQEGALVDVVTMGHIELALAAGVPPSALVFNGNSKTLEELRWAAEHGMAYVNVDSLEELEALAGSVADGAPAVRVCVRLALDERPFAAADPEFAVHWLGAKFGMDEDDALAAAALASEHPGLELAGLHQHFGWPVYGTPYDTALDLERHVVALEQVVAFALRRAGSSRQRAGRSSTSAAATGFRAHTAPAREGSPKGRRPRSTPLRSAAGCATSTGSTSSASRSSCSSPAATWSRTRRCCSQRSARASAGERETPPSTGSFWRTRPRTTS